MFIHAELIDEYFTERDLILSFNLSTPIVVDEIND